MSGTFNSMRLQAPTIPEAMVAQLTIPPNTFTRIALTFLSVKQKKKSIYRVNKDKIELQMCTRGEDLECLKDLLFLNSASNIKEVCRRSSIKLDNVHRRHGEPSSINCYPFPKGLHRKMTA
jgi:hypothetical protein